MTKPDDQTILVIERELNHSPEKIWRALTEPELLARWIMRNDFKPTAGHNFAFRDDNPQGWSGMVNSKVLEVEKPHRLVYEWNVDNESQPWLRTRVAWTLTKQPSGATLLRMEHSGFKPDQGQAKGGAAYGWNIMLGKLETTLAEALAA